MQEAEQQTMDSFGEWRGKTWSLLIWMTLQSRNCVDVCSRSRQLTGEKINHVPRFPEVATFGTNRLDNRYHGKYFLIKRKGHHRYRRHGYTGRFIRDWNC